MAKRERARALLDRRDHHASIDGDRPFLVGENGIEIELPHLRQVRRELRLDWDSKMPLPGRWNRSSE
jgi:hypothetical protein